MVRQPSILVVDDEVNVARTLQMILERDGYRVTCAYTCAEALSLLRNAQRFDVIVTDLNMERNDIGFQVVREAQTLKPRPMLVICTGYANPQNTRLALELHVDHLALKPVALDELRAAIARFLAMRAAQAASRE